MGSEDALSARTEANLESRNGRSAEFFKMSVLYARRSLFLAFRFKNKRPYKLFVSTTREFLDVQRRMPASKLSMVTYWSGRTSDVAKGGLTMRDSATAGLGDQATGTSTDSGADTITRTLSTCATNFDD